MVVDYNRFTPGKVLLPGDPHHSSQVGPITVPITPPVPHYCPPSLVPITCALITILGPITCALITILGPVT